MGYDLQDALISCLAHKQFPLFRSMFQGVSREQIEGMKVNEEGRNIGHYFALNGLNAGDNQYELFFSWLQEKGIDWEVKDKEGKTALIYAVESGFKFLFIELIKNIKVDVNVQDEKGLSALHWAVKGHQYTMVHYLLHHDGIRFDLLDNNKRSYLHYFSFNYVMGSQPYTKLEEFLEREKVSEEKDLNSYQQLVEEKEVNTEELELQENNNDYYNYSYNNYYR